MNVSRSLLIALAAIVLPGSLAHAGLDPALKCEATKLAATGKKADAVLKCHAKALKKGIAVDASCLTKADGKFTKSFEKAEKKVVCTEPGDEATIGAIVDAYTAATVSALPPGAAGAKCASTKLGAAGKKASGSLKAFSKEVKKPDLRKLSKGYRKAQEKLQKSFDKAESKPPCETTGDALDIRVSTDAFVEDVLGIEEPVCPQQLLYSNEGNRMRRFDLDTIDSGPILHDIFIERASIDPVDGRDVNGFICAVPPAVAASAGEFVCGEDTGQGSTTPPGWGVFDSAGSQIGKLTATYFTSPGEPFGCTFNADGNLFTTSIGAPGFGAGNGQLIMWFPPYEEFPGPPGEYPDTTDPSTNFCKIAIGIGTAGGPTIDDDGNLYLPATGEAVVYRYLPPFPTAPDAGGGCGADDGMVPPSPMADSVTRELFIADADNVFTPSGMVRAPNGNWYVSSVFTGIIAEYDTEGQFVRRILEPPAGEEDPPLSTGHPQGIAVDCKGDLYFADLGLELKPVGNPGPGANLGSVRRVRIDPAGNGYPPEVLLDMLNFPDGLGILEGDLETP